MSQINWENSQWKQLSLVNDEEVISLSLAKVHVFSDSVLCLVKVHQNPLSNFAWEEKLSWFKDSTQYRTLDTIDGKPMEFEWNIIPGFATLQLVREVQKFMNKMSDPDQFQGRVIFMSMFNDIVWGIKDNEQECIASATLVSAFAKRFPAGRWSFLGPESESRTVLHDKHTDEFLQFTEPVTCREYTLPRDEKSTDPKGWIRGNTKIGPVLEVTTSYLQGKYGVEIRIESVNKDNSHS